MAVEKKSLRCLNCSLSTTFVVP